MIAPRYGIMPGDFLSLTKAEIERARRRSAQPAWQEAAQRMRERARTMVSDERELPLSDCSWYDADPARPYDQTYQLWHEYNDPARDLVLDALFLLKAAVVFDHQDCIDKAQAWALWVVDRHGFHVDHYDSGMEFAHMGGALAEIFAVVFERLSDDERRRFRDQLTACGEAILRCQGMWLSDPHLTRMAFSNHLALQNRGLLKLGLILDRPDWVASALDGPRGFAAIVTGAVVDDGLCYESSTGYHFATFGALWDMARTAYCCPALGRDLFHQVCAGGRTLKQMLDAPLALLFPNGERPQIGDAYQRSGTPTWAGMAETYRAAQAVYNDPVFVWFLRQSEQKPASLFSDLEELVGDGVAPPGGSRLWIEHGYARAASENGPTYWQGVGFTAFLNGNPSGIHHHKDRLSLQVFAGKRLWTVDAMCESTTSHGFSAPVQEAFNRTMLAHNVVVVDQQNQQAGATALPVIVFRELPGCTTMSMSDDAGSIYSGVRMRRHVAVTDHYCLDVCEVIGDGPHTFDWLVHPRSDGPVESDRAWQTGHLSDQGPYAILTESERSDLSPAGADLIWSQAEDRMHLSVTAGESGTIWRCRYPLTDRGEGQGEFFMVRSQGSRAIFTALYQMQNGDRCWRVASSRQEWNGEWHEIRVSLERDGESQEQIFRGLS